LINERAEECGVNWRVTPAADCVFHSAEENCVFSLSPASSVMSFGNGSLQGNGGVKTDTATIPPAQVVNGQTCENTPGQNI
jgi:hypothetical protein